MLRFHICNKIFSVNKLISHNVWRCEDWSLYPYCWIIAFNRQIKSSRDTIQIRLTYDNTLYLYLLSIIGKGFQSLYLNEIGDYLFYFAHQIQCWGVIVWEQVKANPHVSKYWIMSSKSKKIVGSRCVWRQASAWSFENLTSWWIF